MNTSIRLNPDQAQHHHRWRVFVAMSLYVVLLFCSIHFIKQQHPTGPLLVALALLPTVPVVWVMWSLYVYLTQADELQRRVHLTSLSMAAGVTAAFSIVYGLLEESAGFPYLSVRWGIMLIGLTWVASGMVLWRRYK